MSSCPDVATMTTPQLHAELFYLRQVAQGEQPAPRGVTRTELSERYDTVATEYATRTA